MVRTITELNARSKHKESINSQFLGPVGPVYTSDFVTNSYGESWNSSCEKSGVAVQNQ